MGEYKMLEKHEAEEIFKAFPKIDAEACTEETNSLFTPYLFFHRGKKDIELWCSSCMKHGHMDYLPRLITEKEQTVLEGKHNGSAVCPFCGKRVTLKDTGHLGKKKNLLEYHPVIFLKAKSGKLYARAYWSMKDYQGKLNAPPRFMLASAYIFRPGKAIQMYENIYEEYHVETLEGNYDPVHRKITEPFMEGSGFWWKHTPYTVFGLEEIADSDFRYCQYEKYEAPEGSLRLRRDCMKYLAASCIYPRSIEMCMKTGMEQLVSDLVTGRRKNARIIDWKADSCRDAFGLDRNELKAWKASGAPIEALRTYKQLKRKKMPESFETLTVIYRDIYDTEKFLKYSSRYGLRPSALYRYLMKCSRKSVRDPADVHSVRNNISVMWQLWKDYTDMCSRLGYDLENTAVLMPKELRRKHDEAVAESQLREARIAAERNAELQRKAEGRLKRWREKYSFQLEDYFVRPAENAEEIILEGKTLQHCVGGYAERHLKGQLTILFLRRCDTPEASLYTIEMNGNYLVQIHGYRNEWGGQPSPRKTMDWFLKPWLSWLAKGSPRRKDGTPRLPEERKTA